MAVIHGMRAITHRTAIPAGVALAAAGLASIALTTASQAAGPVTNCSAKPPAPPSAQHWSAARRKLAPRGASSIQLCRYSGLNAHPPRELTDRALLTDSGVVRRLTTEFDRLPREPRRPVACPADDGSEIVATFAYASEHQVTIDVNLTGCTSATDGSVSRRATEHLINRLERLAGQGQ